jgi:hypothetical protein
MLLQALQEHTRLHSEILGEFTLSRLLAFQLMQTEFIVVFA